MARIRLISVLTLAAVALPAAAVAQAPAAPPGALYCMKVEAPTGSRVEPVMCWTREEWAWEGVDVDHDWAKEGVAVIG